MNTTDPGQASSARLSRKEAKARTRSLLLEAAAKVFAHNGYAGASVDDVAEAAGFSTGALYSNFSGKEDLFIALFTERNRERTGEAVKAILDPAVSGEDRRANIAELLLNEDEADEAMLQAEFWLFAMRHPELRDQFAAQVHKNRESLSQALAAWARAHGRPDTIAFDDLATVLVAVFRGLVQMRRTDPALVTTDLYASASRWLIEGATRTAGQRESKGDHAPA
jgi:AcrR family transcriptional regulator